MNGVKRTVLFVDDEPNILMGLRRLLRPLREGWDFHFATGGKEGLEIMERQAFDAVVSDMRMPGMDGPEFLTHVMKRHPDVVRFALSGFSDQEMVGRAIAPTHQYLTKPCEAGAIIAALEQAIGARQLVANQTILKKIARIEHLPALPEAYRRITEELAKGDPAPKTVGDIVARDVGLSANLLKLVNSAYFGLSRHVTDPHQAVIVLGVDLIRSLILSLHVFNSLSSGEAHSFSLQLLWSHCLRTSAIARAMAESGGQPKAVVDMACTAALLHDLGKLILDIRCPEECAEIYRKVRAEDRRVADVEMELLGVTHAQVGGYLLGLWGLPGAVVRAVAAHHDPAPPEDDAPLTSMLHFANFLEHETFVFNERYARPQANPAWLARIGGEAGLDAWRDLVGTLDLAPEGE